jgi:hypothetical protein
VKNQGVFSQSNSDVPDFIAFWGIKREERAFQPDFPQNRAMKESKNQPV